MSEEFFSAPPFKPAEALLGLKRQLREARLTERGATFEAKGHAVVELNVNEATLDARIVKRPAQSPEWDRFALKSGADVRKFVDEVRKRLARWADADA